MAIHLNHRWGGRVRCTGGLTTGTAWDLLPTFTGPPNPLMEYDTVPAPCTLPLAPLNLP